MPAEPLSAPVGRTAELPCTYSTSVGDNFALEWSFVPPGKPISASHPVSWEHLRRRGALLPLVGVGWERQAQRACQDEGAGSERVPWLVTVRA